MDSCQRAMLLSDVVDSTKLTSGLGTAEFVAIWAAHDAAARDLLRQWRGREVNRSDGMLLMFESAEDAVAYALDYHAALAALEPPFRARVAVHVGEVVVQDNAPLDVAYGAKAQEVFGQATPVVARVMPLAQAGQTLLTADAEAVLSKGRWKTRAEGWWRLKGVAEPLAVFAVANDTAGLGEPPQDAVKAYRVVRQGELWIPARDVPGNIPAARDMFVGRRSALAAVEECIDNGARLLTLTGFGGMGKTRLALEYARRWRGDFAGGTWFCDLSAATDEAGVVHAVALALGEQLSEGDSVEQVAALLAGRDACLLVLDNFEQVTAHASNTLGRWLDATQGATFLVTSREALGIAGEQLLTLPPLPADEAAELFTRRASAQGRQFSAAEGGEELAELVRMLDGLPLALELAASRALVMPPRVLLQRIGRRFELLVNARGTSRRHASLQATLDWSWELLSPAERDALAQLSVLQGSFSLEAAEAVVRLEPEPAGGTCDLLLALVQKSLVRAAPNDRFEMLVSVREYAASRLQAGRHEAEVRHATYFSALEERQVQAHLGVELDNVLCALARAQQWRADDQAAALLERAAVVILRRGPFSRGIDLARRLADLPGIASGPCARATVVAGRALALAGQGGEAIAAFERAIDLARTAGDRRTECLAINQLAISHFDKGAIDRAAELNASALGLLPLCAEPDVALRVYNTEGTIAYVRGRLHDARRHFGKASEASEAAGGTGRSLLLSNVGCLSVDLGHLDEAHGYLAQAIAVGQADGQLTHETVAVLNFANVQRLRGRHDEAVAHYERALELARSVDGPMWEAAALHGMGLVRLAIGQLAHARTALERGVALALSAGDRNVETGVRLGLAQVALAEGNLGDAREQLEAAEAFQLQSGDRLGRALLLAVRAAVARGAHDAPGEAAAVAEAMAICRDAGLTPQAEPMQLLAGLEAQNAALEPAQRSPALNIAVAQ